MPKRRGKPILLKNAKHPWPILTGVYAVCLCVHTAVKPAGSGFISLALIGALALVLPACAVLLNQGVYRRYFFPAVIALCVGAVLLFL